MTEWTVEIETAGGVAADADALERFADALDGDPRARGSAASINVRTGSVAATFTVDAPDAAEAAAAGVTAFREALAAAGLTGGEPAKITVELVAIEDAVPA
jgi:hypothetical protein